MLSVASVLCWMSSVHACSAWVVSDSSGLHGAHQAPLSMGFPRQESWSGLPFPPPGVERRKVYVRWILWEFQSPMVEISSLYCSCSFIGPDVPAVGFQVTLGAWCFPVPLSWPVWFSWLRFPYPFHLVIVTQPPNPRHLSVYPSIYPPISPSTHLHPSIHPLPSIHSSIHSLSHPVIHLLSLSYVQGTYSLLWFTLP